jgi:hypothetical protein
MASRPKSRGLRALSPQISQIPCLDDATAYTAFRRVSPGFCPPIVHRDAPPIGSSAAGAATCSSTIRPTCWLTRSTPSWFAAALHGGVANRVPTAAVEVSRPCGTTGRRAASARCRRLSSVEESGVCSGERVGREADGERNECHGDQQPGEPSGVLSSSSSSSSGSDDGRPRFGRKVTKVERRLAAAKKAASTDVTRRKLTGARAALRDADAEIGRFAAKHYAELRDALNAEAVAVAARVDAALVELATADRERALLAARAAEVFTLPPKARASLERNRHRGVAGGTCPPARPARQG